MGSWEPSALLPPPPRNAPGEVVLLLVNKRGGIAVPSGHNNTPGADWARGDPLLLFDREKPRADEASPPVVTPTFPIDPPASRLFTEPDTHRSPVTTRNGRPLGTAALLVLALLTGYIASAAIRTLNSGDWWMSRVETRRPPAASLPVRSQPSDHPPATNQPANAASDGKGLREPVVASSPQVIQPLRAPAQPRGGNLLARPTTGTLHVESRPAGAHVYLDGRLVTTTPFRMSRVPAGAHTVRMELQGYRPWSMTLNLIGGSRVRIGARLDVKTDGPSPEITH